MLGAVFHSTLCFLLFTSSSLPLFPPFLGSLAALAARQPSLSCPLLKKIFREPLFSTHLLSVLRRCMIHLMPPSRILLFLAKAVLLQVR